MWPITSLSRRAANPDPTEKHNERVEARLRGLAEKCGVTEVENHGGASWGMIGPMLSGALAMIGALEARIEKLERQANQKTKE